MPTDYDKRLTPAEFKDLMAFLTRQGMMPPPAPGRGGAGAARTDRVMRTRYGLALTVLAIAGTFGGWSAATRAQQSAPYTDQQATAGQAAYTQSCAACHGRTLSGGGEAPALAGSAFMDTWGPHTTQELFTRIRDVDAA